MPKITIGTFSSGLLGKAALMGIISFCLVFVTLQKLVKFGLNFFILAVEKNSKICQQKRGKRMDIPEGKISDFGLHTVESIYSKGRTRKAFLWRIRDLSTQSCNSTCISSSVRRMWRLLSRWGGGSEKAWWTSCDWHFFAWISTHR